MGPLLVGALHAEHDGTEMDEQPDDNGIEDGIHHCGHRGVDSASNPIHAETKGDDSVVESWVVVVDVSHTRHDDERKVVQNPTNSRVNAGIVDVVNLLLGKLLVSSLPAQKVPDEQETEANKTASASPVDERVAEKVILHNIVIPGAHAQTDVQDRPLPEVGGQVILLIRVGNQGIVRGHHGNIQVDEVLQEGRLVGTRVTRGHCEHIVSPSSTSFRL